MKKLSRPTAILIVCMLVNLAWRLIFLPASQSSYTDGILQIDMFRQGVSYWPPLYAVLARMFAWLPGLGLEGAGRLVSILCGVLALWPLHAVARRLFGLRAAFWAMAAWTVTPMALQWSMQVMTDMPFTLFWMASLAGLLVALERYLPGLFPPPEDGATPEPAPRQGGVWLMLASTCAALGTLTRYQGILLLPLVVLAAWRMGRVRRVLPGPKGMNPWLALLPWLAVAGWLVLGASTLLRHVQQIGDRTGGIPRTALINYWFLFEEFLLKSPYFVGYGLFGFMLYGLFRTQWATARLRWSGWAALYLGLALFAMQSVFQSYQARYLLPLVPLVCLAAGHGLATWERHSAGRPLRLWGLALPALAQALVLAVMVVVYQGSPFKEIKDAALFVKSLNLPPDCRVYTNESYAALGPVKVRYWTGRKAEAIWTRAPRPGDIILLSSYEAGSLEQYKYLRGEFQRNLPAKELRGFTRAALPLITDIMAEAGTAQNPLAWVLRYKWQYYSACVLQMQKAPGAPPTADEILKQPIAPIPPLPKANQEKIEKLRSIQRALEKAKE